MKIWPGLMPLFVAVASVSSWSAAYGQSAVIPFDSAWEEQKFMRKTPNVFQSNGAAVEIASDGAVSMFWRRVDINHRDVTTATWNWSVSSGVQPTDLTIRGEDDRSVALYFVFVDPEMLENGNEMSIRRLLRSSGTRTLVYVWGGKHAQNAVLPSPYSDDLKMIVKRTDANGTFSEIADLRRDLTIAFEHTPKVLAGIAISADSDDAQGKIRATVSDLRLQ